MKRKEFIRKMAIVSILPYGWNRILHLFSFVEEIIKHIRPGDQSWPSESIWEELKHSLDGRLTRLESPLNSPQGSAGKTEPQAAVSMGAPKTALENAKNTAINPAVLDAFALALVAGSDDHPEVWPGIEGHEPDLNEGVKRRTQIDRAMDAIYKIVPQPASYISESNYFEKNWQQSFWGTNYSRLAGIKKKYDPKGLFFIHHGVGSEEWTDNGFTRVK